MLQIADKRQKYEEVITTEIKKTMLENLTKNLKILTRHAAYDVIGNTNDRYNL